MSAILNLGYDENVWIEKGADGLTAYGEWRVLTWIVADTWSQKTGLRLAWVGAAESVKFSLHKVRFSIGFSYRGRFARAI